MDEAPKALLEAIKRIDDELLLVVTGAGVSHASGIATFRGSDPGAVWKQHDVARATRDYFERDPAGQWEWYLSRFQAVDTAEPNAAHVALAELERWQTGRGGAFRLVTQNIDLLHERAGSRDLIKVHGSSDRVRCTRDGCEHAAPTGSLARTDVDLEAFRRDPVEANLPSCPACDALLRPHVLFFDEYYQEHADYRFDDVRSAADEARLVLFVGTSFSVGVTDLILQAAREHRVPSFSVDPDAAPLPPWMKVTQLRRPAEEALPSLVRELRAGG